MKNIEEIRTKLTSVWNKLIFETGAISLIKPSLYSCILGIIWKVCAIKVISVFNQ